MSEIDKTRRISAATLYEGLWPPRLTDEPLPHLRRQFDLNRCQYIRAQMLDQEQQEGRGERQGDRSNREAPAPALKPKGALRHAGDQAGWLAQQRQDAMRAQLQSFHTRRACAKAQRPHPAKIKRGSEYYGVRKFEELKKMR